MVQRIGIDIGGTFTDLVAITADGRVITHKIASTPHDYGDGIIDGLRALLASHGDTVGEVLHATTIGSNTVLEGKGARTGLITTKGFRDILEIRDLRMPVLYDLHWTKPRALVERRLRLEVVEKLRPDGSVAVPLDSASVAAAIDMLRREEVQSVAICLLHSYANAVHERAVAEAVRAALPNVAVSVSHEILPEIKEYPRTSTTVINAYVQPVVRAYVTALAARLRALGIEAPLQLMQSNGGLASVEFAAAAPAHIIESGPAAGVVGGAALAAKLDEPRVITFDMGGTTAKAGLVENGEVLRSEALEVGAGVMTGSRLLVGAGYLLKLPAIDLAEVGAGGGSICRLDAGGAPKVGPDSAGAEPGPVCYGRGGTQPTITDCNLVLGYLDPGGLVGGALKLDAEAAHAAVARELAEPLQRSRRGSRIRYVATGLGVDDACDPRGIGGARSRSSAVRSAGVRWQRSAVRHRNRHGTGHHARYRTAVAGRVQRIRPVGRGRRTPREPEPAHAARRRRRRSRCRGADGVDRSGRTPAGARRLSAGAARIPARCAGTLRWPVERNRGAATERRWRIPGRFRRVVRGGTRAQLRFPRAT